MVDGDFGFDGLEFVFEFLDFVEVVGDDFGVLLVELFEVGELGLVVGDVLFDGSEFFGEVGVVDFVVGGGGGLEYILDFLFLVFLVFDLVFEEGDLVGELFVGVVGFVGFGFGVVDVVFDDGLVDGIVFSGFFGGEVELDEDVFDGVEEFYGRCVC